MDRTYLMVDDYLPSVLNRWYFKCVHSVCLGGIFARAFVWLRFCSNDLVQLIPLPTSVQTKVPLCLERNAIFNSQPSVSFQRSESSFECVNIYL